MGKLFKCGLPALFNNMGHFVNVEHGYGAVKMIKEKQRGSAIVYSGDLSQHAERFRYFYIFEPSFLE
jgi:hypothetical protein